MKPNENAISSNDTITLNIEAFITPFAMIISALIIAGGFIIGTNNLKLAISAPSQTTTTPTTDTTGTNTGSTVTQESLRALFTSGNYMTFGDANSPLLLVEISDPSCPYCHIAAGKNAELNKSAGAQFTLVADGGTYVSPVVEMKKLVDEGKAAFAWIYSNGHGNGEMGTKAMYCAYDQGKFWEAHDLLMSASGYSLVNDTVKNDKAKSGELANFLSGSLDSNALKECLDNGKYDSRIASEQSAASALGVQGTPGFFVNTKNFPGAYSWTDMKSATDGLI